MVRGATLVGLGCGLVLAIGCSHAGSSAIGSGGNGGNGGSGGNAGATTVITLATGRNAPGDVVVDAANVYWVENETLAGDVPYRAIMKMPIGGGAPLQLASEKDEYFTIPVAGLVAAGPDLYWFTCDGTVVRQPTTCTIKKTPIAGGPTTVVAQQSQGVVSLAADETGVYWVGYSANGWVIRKAPAAGGATVTLGTGGGWVSFGGIALDATHIYWTGGAGDHSRVARMSRSGGGMTTLFLAPGAESLWAIALGGSRVYWAYDDALMTVPADGGTPHTIGCRPNALAADQTGVYWTRATDGALMRTTPDGASTVIAADQYAGSIAVDATSIYFSTGDGVRKVNKLAGVPDKSDADSTLTSTKHCK